MHTCFTLLSFTQIILFELQCTSAHSSYHIQPQWKYLCILYHPHCTNTVVIIKWWEKQIFRHKSHAIKQIWTTSMFWWSSTYRTSPKHNSPLPPLLLSSIHGGSGQKCQTSVDGRPPRREVIQKYTGLSLSVIIEFYMMW